MVAYPPQGLVTKPVRRADMEYPTEDVPLSYLGIIGKLTTFRCPVNPEHGFVLTSNSFTDKAIETYSCQDLLMTAGRRSANDYYVQRKATYKTTADHEIKKRFAGTWSVIAAEAVDLDARIWYWWKLSCSGTTIAGYRDDLVTPKISVIDTDIPSGQFGIGGRGDKSGWFYVSVTFLRAPSSPSPRTIGYFEVPIVGSGTIDDPFRAQLPEELERHPRWGPINRLALSHASLIRVGRDGKPIEYVTVVRIFDQPDRQGHLRPIDRCLDALREMGAKELTREEAIRRAKELDDKLTDKDLKGW